MRRAISAACIGIGGLLVQGGKVLAWLTALALTLVGIIQLVQGNIAQGLLALFPGVPLIAGFVNILISLPGAAILGIGLRLRNGGGNGPDRITRRALATDPEVREIWEKEFDGIP